MTLAIAPATRAHVVHVVENMWTRGREEMARFGHETPAAVERMLVERIGERFSYAMLDGEVPIAYLGALRIVPDGEVYGTWFQATERFVELGAAPTRAFRRWLVEKAGEHPEAEINLFSGSDHPAAEAWFRLIGFQRNSDWPTAPHVKAYRYLRR